MMCGDARKTPASRRTFAHYHATTQIQISGPPPGRYQCRRCVLPLQSAPQLGSRRRLAGGGLKHASDSALERVEPLLMDLRGLSPLREKKRGVFYRGGRAFLHFHEDGSDVYADVRMAGTEFERFRVSTDGERRRLFAVIRSHLTSD
jgi:hypothetical protein